jgi:hypothetical protein
VKSESLVFDFSCSGTAHGNCDSTSVAIRGKPLRIDKPTGRAVAAVEITNLWLRESNVVTIRAHISDGKNVTVVQSARIRVAFEPVVMPVSTRTERSAPSGKHRTAVDARLRFKMLRHYPCNGVNNTTFVELCD